MEAEISGAREDLTTREELTFFHSGKDPSLVLSGPPQLLPAGGLGSLEKGGGPRNTGPGPLSSLLSDSNRSPSGLGSSAPLPTRAGGGTPGTPRPSPAGSNKGAPSRGWAGLRQRFAERRAAGTRTAWERAGPAWLSPRSAVLPGVRGVPVDRVAEAGAPPQARAEQRGPEHSPQQGQQPHRPWGPVWSGPAGPGPLLRPGEKGTKVEGGGGYGTEEGCGDS